MEKNGFPIWTTLDHWPLYYHFYHYVSVRQENNYLLRNIVDILFSLQVLLKLSLIPVILSRQNSSRFCVVIGNLLNNIMSLEFINSTYLTLIIFAYVLLITLYIIYYFYNLGKMFIHHSIILLNFNLQEIAPFVLFYAASCLQKQLQDIINGKRNYLLLVLSTISFLILIYYTYVGCAFRIAKYGTNSISDAFWCSFDAFWIIIVPNVFQLVWILHDYVSYGIYISLALSLAFSIACLLWLGTFPYIEKNSNIFAINIFGITSFILILEILFVANVISLRITVVMIIVSVVSWKLILGNQIFNFFSYLIEKISKFEPDELFDIDNNVQLPEIRTFYLIILCRYLILKNFKDIHTLLVAAVDSERDLKLTLECSRMLMVRTIIPLQLRKKINEIDKKRLRFYWRPLLCQIQYYIDKLIVTKMDVDWSISILEHLKSKVKVSLYSFVNSLCENNLNKRRFTCALNHSILCQNLMDLAEYSLEGNPLALDLNECYSDFLSKIGGDFERIEKLKQKADEIKISFIKMESENHLFLSNKKYMTNNLNENVTHEQLLNYQNLIDQIPYYTINFMIFLCFILGFFLLFPIISISHYTATTVFDPDVYFDHYHSPIHFKNFLLLRNIDVYAKYYISNNMSLFDDLSPTSISNIKIYLNSLNCPNDNKPIFDGSGKNISNFPDTFYNFMADQEIFFTYDSNGLNHILNSHNELVHIDNLFKNLTGRYLLCTKNMSLNGSQRQIYVCSGMSLLVFIVLIFFILVRYKRSLSKIVEVFTNIETSTLEEFRSKLFVTLHQTVTAINDYDSEFMPVVDNDGALDLEEIEADENQTNMNNNDDTDLIEEYLTAPIFFKVYDPAIPKTFLVIIFCLFVIRYSIVPITTESYKQSRKIYITNKVLKQIEFELISNLLLEIDSTFANLSGISDIYPEKIYYTDNIDKDLQFILTKWNLFIDDFMSYNESEKLNVISSVLDLLTPIYHQFHEYDTKFAESNAKYAEIFHWLITFLLFFIYLIICYRFITMQYYISKNLRHIVLILHSKYTATASIMMNVLNFHTIDNKNFDIDKMSEIIASQLRDCVLFFDNQLHITGMNQQATANLGFVLESDKTLRLEKIINPSKNKDFYSFMLMMKNAYGVRAKRYFDFVITTKDESNIFFSGLLIPLFGNIRLSFALCLRNQTDIMDMKKELEQLNKNVHSLLKRLVPDEITGVLMEDKKFASFVSKGSSVLSLCLKSSNDNNSNNKLLLDDADITQVCLSLIDRIMANYKNITRIRPFNGNFMFISGLFKEENANEGIVKMIQFANDVAYSINSYTECESLVTCVMSYGGPVYGCMTGISKTLFDVFGLPLVECFDLMDLAPPGKILFVNDAYEMIDDKMKLSPFKANRIYDKKLFVLNSYIGMDFVQDQ